MSFKTKNRKKLVADTRVTLHAKHESKVNYFQEKKKDLETKKNDLNILVKRFEEKYQDKEIDECDIDKKMELLDNINKGRVQNRLGRKVMNYKLKFQTRECPEGVLGILLDKYLKN